MIDIDWRNYENREEWLAARTMGIGGSDVACICTRKGRPISKWGTPYSTWASKVHPDPIEKQTQNQLIWGTVLEPGIRAMAAHAMGCTIQHDPWSIVWGQESNFGEMWPPVFASLDGLITEPTTNIEEVFGGQPLVGPGILECKTDSRAPWKRVPLAYQLQCQHAMMVTEAQWCLVAVYFNRRSEVMYYGLLADEIMQGKIFKSCKRFWRYVTENKPPPIGPSHRDKETVSELHPNDNGDTVGMDHHMEAAMVARRDIKQQIKELETQSNQIDNLVRETLGDATYGVCLDGSSVSWRTQHRKESVRVIEAMDFRVLRYKKGT